MLIPCRETLYRKLSAIKKDGAKNLHLVTDYDQTLTKAKFADGHSCDSSFKTIISYPGMPDNIRELAAALYHKYYPIEQDVTLSKDKKMPYLIEWW